MVKLTKIYTRGGDHGETSLGDGSRVAKYNPRVEAYGTVDEANAEIGVARLYCEDEYDRMLGRIQNELFDLGADLCRPENENKASALRIVPTQVARLEKEIDEMNKQLSPLDSFVLPGGSKVAARLHVARTIVRRAERLTVALAQCETINPIAINYLNRLSDHLFQLARLLNEHGKKDVLWQPGMTR